jgi:hypothetical protein
VAVCVSILARAAAAAAAAALPAAATARPTDARTGAATGRGELVPWALARVLMAGAGLRGGDAGILAAAVARTARWRSPASLLGAISAA